MPFVHRSIRSVLTLSALWFALLMQPSIGRCADVILSEFMASNLSGIIDEDGATSDWIEVLNVSSAPINLAGWRLTDDPADLSKWIFPSTNLPPNGFLLVWADSKNRRISGAPLHANFNLSSAGEYLALIRPNDSFASEFNPYPKQYDNISYGVVQQTDVSQFIGTNASVKYYIPSNNTLGLTWTVRSGFTEAGWATGTNGLGFEQSVPGFAVKNYKANTIVGDLTTASNLLSNPSQQSAVFAETRNVINYFNSGGPGNYGGDVAFPGFDLITDQDNFVVEATGTITIPTSGPRTFGVNSDDGFYLQIGSFSVAFPTPRGASDTLATFNFPTAGDYPVRLIFYEQGGGSELEFWAAPGTLGAWNPTNFRLVGDTANGGLAVKSTPIGQTGGLRSLVKTDILKSMYNKSASAYIRYPFTVGTPAALNSLTLGVRYDDGFALYLNGTLVGTRNAPGVLAFDSVATIDRTNSQSTVREVIDLTPQLGLLVPGSNLIAVHALNRATNNGDFLFAADLSEVHVTLMTNNYFTLATPNGFNSTNIYEKVRDTRFSHDRGFYDTNFNLTITSETPGATIRYTLDGTLPTLANGATFASPIAITKTTTVRAGAFKAGYVSSDIDTHTYLYTRDIILQSPNGEAPGPLWPAPRPTGGQVYDYGMDPEVVTNSPWKETIQSDLKSLPTFSVVMNLNDLFDPGSGIYANPGGDTLAWERACSLELINADGTTAFHENCGIRIRGGYSRTTDNPKHAFRFFFRQEYGATRLAYPVFGKKGAPSFDKFDLRTTQNYSWAFGGDPGSIFLRDQFSRDTQLDMGQLGERGNWFHLYVNGVYWGLYNTDERAEAAFGESYVGGLAEDYDTIKVGPDQGQGYNIYATDGNLDAWTRLWQAATNGFASDASYFRVQGLNADGTPNSLYEALLDLPNLIDYMLVIIYGGNLDAPISNFLGNNAPNNWFGIRDRTGAHGGFRFMSHDAEHTLLDPNQDRTGPFAAGDPTLGSSFVYSNPQYIFTRLWANAEFRMTCADRIQKHFFNGGALTVSNAQARLDVRTNEIFRALVPESARWGDAKRGSGPPITRADWQSSYDSVRNNYLPARGNIVINQLRSHNLYPNLNGPILSQFGGLVPFGYNLTITNTNPTGAIYYTLDGSDPRLRGGGINAAAIVYVAPIAINTARTVRARIKDGGTWSAIVETTFYPIQNFDGLAITEIMYNPPGEGLNSGDEYEFVELKNTTANTIDMSGLSFSGGVSFTFTNATRLAAGQFWVIVKNPVLFHARYPSAPIHGVFTGKLGNNGETVRVKHVLGGTVFTVSYKDSLPWPVAADGYGFSLVPKEVNPTGNSDDGSQWRASTNPLGSPGTDDPASTMAPIVINELLTHTDLPQIDAVELFNPTANPVNIGGWFLSDSAGQPKKYRVPDNTILGPMSYRVFNENDFNNPPTATNSFRLSSIGDQIYLLSGNAQSNLTGYSHGVAFGAAQNGVSFGRYVNSQGEEHYPAQLQNTFGATNAGPRIGPVILSEIQYHPDPAFDEFIEIQNISSTNVPLYDPSAITNRWKIGAINFTFPPSTILPPGGFMVLSPIDPTLFRTRYAVPTEVPILGPYTGHLQDSGERLELTRPDVPNTNGFIPYLLVDGVRYNDKLPWPVVADGSGPSLQRRVATAYADDPTNWFSSGITPGRVNLPNSSPLVSITSPADGSSYLPPSNIPITASASDPDGLVRKVEFFADGVKIGEDLTSPYGVTWSNAPSGLHTLTAKAIDSGLAISVSDPVVVAVFPPTATTAIAKGSDWNFLDGGVAPANTWTELSFNDSTWKHGPAQLGYGDGDEATLVSFGTDANNKFITTWFRKTFTVGDASRYLTLIVSVLRDDGAVVYLNGTEIFRSNMPDTPIAADTKALGAVGGADEISNYYSTNVPPNLLINGNNILAVEIHQSGPTSSDISFDLELTGTIAPQVPSVTWTSPANNARFVAPASIPLAANASDLENGINRIDFYEGTRKLGQDTTPPYTFDWSAVPAGNYALRAVAVNPLGLARTSSIVNVVVESNAAPLVTLTNPPNGSIIVQPASLAVGASASDPDGTVQRVDFLLDDAPLGSSTIVPYSVTWSAPSLGSHVIKAIATDNRGVSTLSLPVTVIITNRFVQPFTFVSQGSLWRYNDRGVHPGPTWTSLNFADGSWPRGLAQFGYSPDENDEITVLSFGINPNNKYPTYYFRHPFVVKDKASVTQLQLRFLRDDGIVAYLNGSELFRDNMPGGAIDYPTLATLNISGADESAFHTNTLNAALLINGTNILTVEIHQQAVNNSDVSFDAELFGLADPMTPLIHDQPLSRTVPVGGTATFQVTAGGSTPLRYQWSYNGAAIANATNTTHTIVNLQTNHAGEYSVIVANTLGTHASSKALLIVTTPDTDGDGLPDWWEDAHQLNKLDAADASLDSDGDGLTNLQEYLAGTDPKDSKSGLRLIVTPNELGVLLEFNAIPGHDYVLQYSETLEPGSWKTLKTIQSSSVPSVSSQLESGILHHRFYRVLTPAR